MKQIWMVDSNPILMKGIEIALQQLDVETRVFPPFDFLRQLSQSEMPDMIVLNRHLEGVDTADVLRVLRRHPKFGRIPRIVIVNKSYPEELHSRMLMAGASEVIHRDMPAREFTAVVEDVLSDRSKWTMPAYSSALHAAVSGTWSCVA